MCVRANEMKPFGKFPQANGDVVLPQIDNLILHMIWLLDSVQNLCVSSKVLIFVVEYKSNKNNGAYDATNIGIIFHISLLWRSF